MYSIRNALQLFKPAKQVFQYITNSKSDNSYIGYYCNRSISKILSLNIFDIREGKSAKIASYLYRQNKWMITKLLSYSVKNQTRLCSYFLRCFRTTKNITIFSSKIIYRLIQYSFRNRYIPMINFVIGKYLSFDNVFKLFAPSNTLIFFSLFYTCKFFGIDQMTKQIVDIAIEKLLTYKFRGYDLKNGVRKILIGKNIIFDLIHPEHRNRLLFTYIVWLIFYLGKNIFQVSIKLSLTGGRMCIIGIKKIGNKIYHKLFEANK